MTPTYTTLEKISHIIVALYVASSHRLPAEISIAVATYAPYVDAVASGLEKSGIPEPHMARARKLLAAAHSLITQAASTKGVSQE